MHVRDMFRLNGKVAIVTGGSVGLGAQMATALAEAGADVVIAARKKDRCIGLATKLGGLNIRALPVACDVSKAEDCQLLVDITIKELGRLDILVNNAAVAIHEDLEDATEKTWNETIDINLKGTFFCAHAVGKVMIQQRKGKIINILSNCSFVAEAGIGIYCASKGGLLMITRCLATEWGKYGINVNGIGPAFILTPMNEPLLKDKHFVKWSSNRIPFHRMGKPDEMVGAAIYLASDAASFVNGAVVMVDGGFTAC